MLLIRQRSTCTRKGHSHVCTFGFACCWVFLAGLEPRKGSAAVVLAAVSGPTPL